jgi:hypothetical protein
MDNSSLVLLGTLLILVKYLFMFNIASNTYLASIKTKKDKKKTIKLTNGDIND